MSCGCMYIIKSAIAIGELKKKLLIAAQTNDYGVCFNPINNLLLENSISIGQQDYIFEICDGFQSSDASLLLSHEGVLINGTQSNRSLLQRMKILQDVALICAPHTGRIEIYLGEDTPHLSDYAKYHVTISSVAETLYLEYAKDTFSPFIPCVHLVVETQ